MNANSNDDPKEPMNDYLWDRSGAPDPEIQHFESLLCEFRYEERPLNLPIEMPRAHRYSPVLMRLAAAAVVILAFGASIYLTLRPGTTAPDAGPGWQVSNLEGAPQIGSRTLSAADAAIKLNVGQTLITDSSSSASLSEGDLGQIRVGPNSRVRLLQSGPNRKRIQLEVGTIHATIWAPPTEFVVDTPSAVAVDLGCAYTLQVASDGSGMIRTTLGWVGFHLNGRDSFIPAGAMCSTRPTIGPGTPYFEDASPKFREALARFDSAAENSADQNSSLASVLAEARAKDALTLWHLLSRTDSGNRQLVYHRLADLVPPPSGVDRSGILALDPRMLDLYWNALDLGDISIWRFWEQSASPNSNPANPQLMQKKQVLLER
jgi:FecR protein